MQPVAPAAATTGLGPRTMAPIVSATLLNALNSSMIAVALLSIQRDFEASAASAAWLISGLYVAAAVSQPIMGRLADRVGPRRVLLGGLGIVLLSGLLAPLAPTLGWLVAARVLLGVGTATAVPSGTAIVRRIADETPGEHPTRALAAISVSAQVSVALGPPLGGLLVVLAGWEAIFLVNVPVVLAGAVMALRWLPGDPPRAEHRPGDGRRPLLLALDPLGIVLTAATLGTLVTGLLELADTPAAAWPWLVVATAAGVLLLAWERRPEDPLVPPDLLVRSGLGLVYARFVLTNVAFYGVFYGLPQWLEAERGLSPLGSGLVLLPIAVVGATVALGASRWIEHRGPRPALLLGSAAVVLGGGLLSLVGVGTPMVVLLGLALLLGIPNGLNSLANQTDVYDRSPADRVGVAAGLLRSSQFVGANLAAVLVAATVGAAGGGLRELALAVAAVGVVLVVAQLLGRAGRGRAAARRDAATSAT